MVPPFCFYQSLIMKKLFLTALFLVVSVCSFAQKSYLQVFADYKPLFVLDFDDYWNIYLVGDKPSDMKDEYLRAKINEILDQLTKKGYTLEFVTTLSGPTRSGVAGTLVYILSKPSEEASAVRSVTIDNDEEATEVARYNLQGMPVNANEKGVQIIVYSNYTAKTIIVK